MRDTEFLLRGLALARGLDTFRGSSLTAFINNFCDKAKRYSQEQTDAAIEDLTTFIHLFDGQSGDVFSRANKFSGVLFEAFFAAWIRQDRPNLSASDFVAAINSVKGSNAFAETLQEGSTKSHNVRSRVSMAEAAIAARAIMRLP